jgi:acetylornithine deacetylase/succinyl-diaminopimelate desuccinylase-like protein
MKKIDVAEKGRMIIRVNSHGKQAHGSTPEFGINAINKLSEFIAKMEKTELSYKAHDILIKPTVNLGIIKGGAAANIVPATCEAIFDVRYLPGQSAEGIVGEFKSVANTVENGQFDFEVEANEQPHEMDPNNDLVKAIQINSENILGWVPETFGLGGRTFAKPFNLGGIQAVGFGPGDESAFHTSNEYLEIKQMLQFTELITCVAVDLLGTK